VRPLGAWFAARFKAGLQYRAAAWAGIFTQFMFGMARVLILLAFYNVGRGSQPISAAQAVTYVWLGQLFFRLMPWSDSELDAEVRTGQIAYNLLRPVPLLGQYFARSLANRVSSALLRFLPFLPVLFLLPAPWGMAPPATVAGGLYWALSMVCAALLSASVNCAMTMFCFKSVVGDGVRLAVSSLSTLLSGMVIPLPLLPDGLQGILMFSPFAGLSDLPSRLYLGALQPSMGPVVVGLQLFWCAAFLGIAWLQMARSLKRLDILGG
jgi:ABC-2 type transport system permease protein